MSAPPAEIVRAFILDFISDGLAAKRVDPSEVRDEFDLLLEGVIDSFGIVELLSELEKRFDVSVDPAEIDVDVLTVLGPLSHHVATLARTP